MINITDIIAASEGFWDTTIAWYDAAPIMLFISVPAMLVAFIFGASATDENSMRKKAIYIGLCVTCVAYIIGSWTIVLTNWHPTDVYSRPTWDTLVEEAYDVAIIADDADDELGDNTNRPCVTVFGRENSDYVIDMTVKDANGYARDYRLVAKNGEITVIDLDSDVIVTPALESDEIAERLITLAEW